jgi:hypothetical protein
MIAGHSNIRNTTSVHSIATFAALLQHLLWLILQSYFCVKLYSAFSGMTGGRWIYKDWEGSIPDLMEVLSLYLSVPMRTTVGIVGIPTKIREVYLQDKVWIITVTSTYVKRHDGKVSTLETMPYVGEQVI